MLASRTSLSDANRVEVACPSRVERQDAKTPRPEGKDQRLRSGSSKTVRFAARSLFFPILAFWRLGVRSLWVRAGAPISAPWGLRVRSLAIPGAALAITITLCACGHAAHQSPSTAVRADVQSAETAELHRQHGVARSRYEKAIADAHDPASEAFARQEFAETLISWGEIAAAKTQLEAAIAAKPDHAASWQDLGMIRNHDGDFAGARAAFERAKQLAPNDPRPRVTLAVLLWKHGDRTGAAAEYRALLELDLPDRLREKVRWAIDELAKPAPAKPAAPTPSS
jgi:hypothetical protein